MNHFDFVILGGGLAGLCAAMRLLELGIHPLVIEAGKYPSQKVCGEFISPASLPLLKKWDIHPIPIHHMELYTPRKNLHFPFPQPAGSLSHLTLDFQLAKQITAQGATLLTETRVLDLTPSMQLEDYHSLLLSNGEKISARHLLIATGRLPGNFSPAFQPQYVGLKAHFSGLQLHSTLHMFSFKNAYLGLSPIENGHANLACLSTLERYRQFSSSHDFMQNLIESHPRLRELLAAGVNMGNGWMEATIPKFGLRSLPNWPRTYWIGDAAGTIPPASGNGLSLALASGYLAAEFAVKDQSRNFREIWKNHCALKIKLAQVLHRLFLNPTWGSKALSLLDCFPSITRRIYSITRVNEMIS